MPRNISFPNIHLWKLTALLSFFIVGFMFAGATNAKEVYIKDSLRVGVRATPGNDATPSAVVVTGMKLTVLEYSGSYIKIRNESGVEGWIKKTYVSSEPPSLVHLQMLQEKHKSLGSKLKLQSEAMQNAEQNIQNLNEEVIQLKETNAALTNELNDERSAITNSRFKYLWQLLIIIVISIASFIVGVIWHRKYAMRRLGGLRV